MIKKTSLFLCMIFLFTACSVSYRTLEQGDKIYMGTNAEWAPFEYVVSKEDGLVDRYDGIDIAISKQIAENLGYELVVKDMNFDFLPVALNRAKIDFIGAAFTATEERAKNVEFSIPYYNALQSLVIMGDNNEITSMEDLDGKVVGVQLGSVSESILEDEYPNVTVKKYEKPTYSLLDLEASKLDAIMLDSDAATFLAREATASVKVIDSGIDMGSDSAYSFAFKKGNLKLKEDFDNEIKKMQENGQLNLIIQKYYE